MAKNTPIKVGKDGFPGTKKAVIPKTVPGVIRVPNPGKADTERIIKLIKDDKAK